MFQIRWQAEGMMESELLGDDGNEFDAAEEAWTEVLRIIALGAPYAGAWFLVVNLDTGETERRFASKEGLLAMDAVSAYPHVMSTVVIDTVGVSVSGGLGVFEKLQLSSMYGRFGVGHRERG